MVSLVLGPHRSTLTGVGTMSLDINTPAGQATLEQEERAYEIYWRNHPLIDIVQTDKTRAAKVDAFLVSDGIIETAVLTSCRKFTVEQLCTGFAKEALLTYEKLTTGAHIADLLCCSLTLFIYAVNDDVLLTRTLYENGKWLTRIRQVDDLPTKATCNGGVVTRVNGMIDVSGAKILRPKPRGGKA